jgi:hypothetical protein
MDMITNKVIKITRTGLNNSNLKKSNLNPNFFNNPKRSFSTIKPLKKLDKKCDFISTMDIETIQFNNIQIPIAVTLSNIKLQDFFGFCLVEVQTPMNLTKGLLPHKHEGKTIFPLGKWKDVYFSEELKDLIKYGYKFKLISG